ncbi:tyrosine-type recombinase/integrase [Rhodopirellula sp. JC639]|uniref:tyrosine-type recombinase/integrase n=1 Tax=Stieleria mannarensis TaxID=2755585 RepID=UPI001603BC52|nr:tyrosine-type recombinase/integrase [Rhodopirellula sp. JC639]
MSVKDGTTRPSKPHKDFPLYAHASGQWAKTIRGKKYFFGTWDDPDAALAKYRASIDAILAGATPTTPSGPGTVGWLCNTFMDAQQAKCDQGDLAKRTLKDYHRVCKYIAEIFGKGRRLETLGPADFQFMRSKFSPDWSPATINTRIRDVSIVFKFAYDVEAVPTRINTGPNFKRVSKKRQRLHKRNQNTKRFTAAEIHKLIDAAPVQLRAMIYLGINAGYGPADCGRLSVSDIDFKRHWLRGLREKTGIERSAWLWPETMAAIRDAMEIRPPARKPEWDDLVFMTTHRKPWYVDGENTSPIQQAFKKAAEAAGVYRKGVGHYALRHTLETEGGTDQAAIDFIMGHVEGTMAGEYREGVPDERVKKVCQQMRKWFKAGKPTPAKNGTKAKRGAK